MPQLGGSLMVVNYAPRVVNYAPRELSLYDDRNMFIIQALNYKMLFWHDRHFYFYSGPFLIKFSSLIKISSKWS